MGLFDRFKTNKKETRSIDPITSLDSVQGVTNMTEDNNTTMDGLDAFNQGSLYEWRVLQIASVQACLDIIGGSFAQCPLQLFITDEDGGAKEIPDDYRLSFWNEDANNILKSDNMRKQIVRDYFLWGYSYIQPNYEHKYSNKIKDLTYIPSRFALTRLKIIEDMVKVVDARIYITMGETGLYGFENTGEPTPMVMQSDLISILKNSSNGVDSQGLLRTAGIILKTALEELNYSSNIYTNASMPIGYLSSNQRLSREVIRRMQESWRQAYSGSSNSFKVAILEEGLKYEPTSLKPDNLLLDSNRTNLDKQIAQLFGVPIQMIDSSIDKAGTVDEVDLKFIKYCLRPFLVQVENALNQTMLTEEEKEKGYFYKFDTSIVTTGTMKDLFSSLATGMNAGILTMNEARIKAGLSSLDREMLKFNIGSMFYDYGEDRMIIPNSKMGINPIDGSINKDKLEEVHETYMEQKESQTNLADAKAQMNESVMLLNQVKAEAIQEGVIAPSGQYVSEKKLEEERKKIRLARENYLKELRGQHNNKKKRKKKKN